MAEFTQIPLGSAPNGMTRYVALLEASPESFSSSLGIKFERVRDHLDELDAAQIRTTSGVYALLGFYVNAPKRGIDVYISGQSTNPGRDVAAVLEAISKARARIIWLDDNL